MNIVLFIMLKQMIACVHLDVVLLVDWCLKHRYIFVVICKDELNYLLNVKYECKGKLDIVMVINCMLHIKLLVVFHIVSVQ